ncbi:MAG: hypothetical protein ABII82_06965 [Verrucomicrobiota bacterium]
METDADRAEGRIIQRAHLDGGQAGERLAVDEDVHSARVPVIFQLQQAEVGGREGRNRR